MCKWKVLRICNYPFSHSSYKTKFAEREKVAEFESEMAASPQNQRILRFHIGENGQSCLASTTHSHIKRYILLTPNSKACLAVRRFMFVLATFGINHRFFAESCFIHLGKPWHNEDAPRSARKTIKRLLRKASLDITESRGHSARISIGV